MADFHSICSVPGCGKDHAARGYCVNHWRAYSLYGDPLGRAPKKKGKVQQWLDSVAVPFQGDECLIFPFSRTRYGYGNISGSLGENTAHSYVAMRVYGPRPTPTHECCHACGKGHEGCVNPRHLYWGTRRDNTADRQKHGVMKLPPVMRGSKNPKAKMTVEHVRRIRALLAEGRGASDISRIINVPKQSVYNVKYGTCWTWVK